MGILRPSYLCITSGLSFISVGLYLFTNNKNIEKNILTISLFFCLVLSQLFWYNPIQRSPLHKIDAFVAKVTIFLFIVYTLFYKNLSMLVVFFYILLGILTILAFYRSDCFSNKEWCCDDHLFNHGLLHVSAFFATLYVYL